MGSAAKVANGKAVYMLSNQASNSVIAVPIAEDGSLDEAGVSSINTGGSGANGVDGSTNQPAVPDALFSQSALAVAGNNLFAVNAGSNSVSMFAIDAGDPTKLTMVGTPAVKGDPTKNNTGFLASFPVNAAGQCQAASVDAEGAQTSPDGTAVLFGSSPIPGSSDLFVTDASFGAAVLSPQQAAGSSPQAPAAFEVAGKGAIDNQMATCWAAISPATNTAFVTDVGVNHLVEMSLDDASIQEQVDLSANGDPGLIDLKAAGNMIYALSPGNGTTNAAVTVVDANSKMQVQHLDMKSLGLDGNAMGMAVLE
ncbi:putative 3-carboxymuconate cyclase [Diaporthe ampelina]|uniref:Putative 3-carboxymuconate cyclase n=1 Tax=Diaporthe ampelina TaxID=1214573 RepID=A0A0G2FJN6_9PEZI|nr:putative 3-carboxymuconate cyclase [Diaporthe ampelina]